MIPKDMDSTLVRFMAKDIKESLMATSAQIQRSAYLLRTYPTAIIHSTEKEQRLIAELMVRVRMLYLFYNDGNGSIDKLISQIVGSMK